MANLPQVQPGVMKLVDINNIVTEVNKKIEMATSGTAVNFIQQVSARLVRQTPTRCI
jgi:hypothetical protein